MAISLFKKKDAAAAADKQSKRQAKAPKRAKKKGGFAGLALHEDALRYIELAPSGMGFNVVRMETVPLPEGTISREQLQLQHVQALRGAFGMLKNRLKGFRVPVVLGMPTRDTTIRLIDYPEMSLEDIEASISLEFENYFPYPWNEAVASISEVDVPVTTQEGNRRSSVLVATSRLAVVNELLQAARSCELMVDALEPMNAAFFRASVGRSAHQGAYFVVCVEQEATNITLGFRDNPILFRSSPVDLRRVGSGTDSDEAYMPILQDIQTTMVFAGNQYRGLSVGDIVLGGIMGENQRLQQIIQASVQLRVSIANVGAAWQIVSDGSSVKGFDTAIGLALRDAE